VWLIPARRAISAIETLWNPDSPKATVQASTM
jgi:hypothetical protein